MDYMATMENFFAYTPMQYFAVSHVLTLGFAVMLAALVYFAMTFKQVAPKYRVMSAISCVVMISAFLILYFQADSWNNAFVFNEITGLYEKVAEKQFTNGYRYLNWLIDVPMLLLQILFVVTLTQAKRFSKGVQFVFSGSAMIILGYLGQFYEVLDTATLWVYGILSTVFFVHILYVMHGLIKDSIKSKTQPAAAKRLMKAIRWLFVVTWLLYPVAYLMPVISWTEGGVVLRQILYTIADIGAKVIYGILLMQVAVIRSTAEKYTWE